jgi:hypothetical protein
MYDDFAIKTIGDFDLKRKKNQKEIARETKITPSSYYNKKRRCLPDQRLKLQTSYCHHHHHQIVTSMMNDDRQQ